MSHLHRFLTSMCLMSVVGGSIAQEPPVKESATGADRLELFTRVAEEYRFTFANDSKHELTLEENPLLRWTNPERDANCGVTWLWIDRANLDP